MESEESVSRLKEKIEKLYSDLQMAGQFGKTLLETNKEYQNRIEELSQEVSSGAVRIEELKQENHVLKSRIETEVIASRNNAFELENMKERLQKEFKEKETAQQNASEKKIKELRKEIESLQNELGKHILVEGQLQEKIQKQEEVIENIRKYSEELQSKSVLETEVEEQRRVSAHLQMELDSVSMSFSDLRGLKRRLEFDNEALKQQIECINEELKEKSRQSETWHNCLQEVRQENGELKAELQALKAEQANKNFRGKGNSLFGEVEDKRLELERKFVSLQAEHDCLVKTYSLTKQQLHRLKSEIAGLFNVKGTHADSSQIERLKSALTHSREEIKRLNAKLASIDCQQADSVRDSRMKEFHEAFSDFGDKKDYVEYLQLQLEESKKANAALKKEFQTKTLLQLSESDKLRYTEGQLHKAECSIDTLNNENMKLRLKVDELRVKLVKYRKAEEKRKEVSDTQHETSSAKVLLAKASNIQSKTNSTHVNKLLPDAESIQEKPKGTVNHPKVISEFVSTSDTETLKKPTLKVTPLQNKSTTRNSSAVTFRKKNIMLNDTATATKSSAPVAESNSSIAFNDEAQFRQNEEPAASHQVVESANTRRKREPSIRFDVPSLEEDSELGTDPINENETCSGPPKKKNRSPDHSSVFSSTKHNESIKVHGQQHAPTVIHVKKDMGKKNECAQQ